MKTLLLMACSILGATAYAQIPVTTSFKVAGNCGMCKSHIEKAVQVDGVSKASWSKETKKMTVTYSAAKITPEQLQQKIAAVGYDTEKYRGDDKAYKELEACCQYDRKKNMDSTHVKH